ncbi:MAG TPA: cyclic nucleotide-binding domain-containing protein [Gammaproteobacteria bacterium]|nr:cyclic nucleotide-binding domain-containing protein [Gammaproteobacteria bacterium]
MQSNSFANIISGSLLALVNISVAVSVAALLFAQTDPRLMVPGIAVLLMGTLVTGLGGSLFSDHKAVICSPRNGLVPVFAVMVSSIYISFDSQYSIAAEATIIAAIMVSTVVVGLFLLLLGRLKLGNLVRYIPYPVTGGFFAGIGYIFIQGGLTVAGGEQPSFEAVSNSEFIQLVTPAVALALCLIMGKMFRDNALSVPAILFAAGLIFYAVLFLNEIGLDEAAANGQLPAIESTGSLIPVFNWDYVQEIRWMVIMEQADSIVVVALLCSVMLLLDVSGIELLAQKDLNPDHELQVMGYTNVVNGALDGFPGVHDVSDTALVETLGGKGRLTGFIYSTLMVAAILAGAEFMKIVPTFLLGGLLIYVGLEFLIDWVWKARDELPLSDYAVVIPILIVIILSDILKGVTFGFFVAIILFVVNYSKLSVIKIETNGSDHASNVDRDLETRELLNKEGNRVLILVLQGFIFFGTADKLITSIRNRIKDPEAYKVDFLVLDFHHVSQLDTSAIITFSKLAQLSDREGFHIVISGADDGSLKQLVKHGFFTFGDQEWERVYKEQLDTAVDWCERSILADLKIDTGEHKLALADVLGRIAYEESDVKLLSDFFVTENRKAGEYLFNEGDKGESLYFVGSGTVLVVLKALNQKERILRKYKSGTILGEMAIYTGENRTASVRIEEDAQLFRLDKEKLEEMSRKFPASTAALHTYIVRVLAERLGRANRNLSRYI